MPIPLGVLAVAGAGAAGGGGSFDLLETTVLGSDTASVTFSGLGTYSTYKHLQLRMVTRNDTFGNILARFNSDTGSNYNTHHLLGNGSSVSSGYSTTVSYLDAGRSGLVSAGSNIFASSIFEILDFSNTSKNKTVRTLTGYDLGQIRIQSGLWMNTNAITSITILAGLGSELMITGSRFSLYGIK